MTLADSVLLSMVALAALWDITQRRVPNAIVGPGILLGLALAAQASGLPGLGAAVLGVASALALLIVPFAMRWMGGGDVKLLMAIGAFIGWRGVLYVLVLGTAIHALVGLGMIFSSRVARSKGWTPPDTSRIPHAVGFAIATGMYTQGVWTRLIH